MNPIYDFKGQVALVTGAAKGMGLATARMFAESGASVVLADIDGDLAAKEAERIVSEGGTAIGIACDVADEAQVAAMVDRAVVEYGRLDMAFNNAGIQVPPSDAADEPIEHFERVTAVNQRGVWAYMKHELRVMRDLCRAGSRSVVLRSGSVVPLHSSVETRLHRLIACPLPRRPPQLTEIQAGALRP